MTTVVLGALWALWPILTLLGGQAISLLNGIAAVLLLPSAARSLRPRLYIFALLAFFVFAGYSATWSPRQQDLVLFDFERMQFAFKSEMLRVGLQIVALGGLMAAAMRLNEAGRMRLQRIASVAMILQLVILGVLAAFETQLLQMLTAWVPDTGEGVQNISRNSLIMSAAAPLLAISLAQGRSAALGVPLMVAVALAAGTILAVRQVNAGLLALGAATACAALVYFLPRAGFRLIALAIVALVMLAPWIFGFLSQGATYAAADDSSSYRAAIWQRVIELIHEHPLTGSGLGVLRTIREPIESGVFAGYLTVPNHSHNMILQLWAETGAVGAALLSLAIMLAGWRMPDARTLGAAGIKGAALVGAMTAVAAVSFDLWNDVWWASGGLLAVLAVATPAAMAREQAAPEGGALVFGETAPAPELAPEPASATPAPQPVAAEHAHNNFNLLRLLFALMVVVYHAVVLPGLPAWKQAEGWLSVGAEIGVQGFFVLSGYLVWASLERSASLGLYAEKRARRLLPGYITVVLACAAAALILVPAARADLAGVAKYVGWNLSFLNFLAPNLPGVFETNPVTDINGALWTLKIEVMFYLILPLLAFILKLAGTRRWIVIALVYVAAELWRAMLGQAAARQGGMLLELSRQLPGQMSFFITGIALCAWRNELNWRSMLAPLGIVLLGVSLVVPQAMPVRAAGLGIVAVWLAVGIPRLFDAARFGDLSYGLYIVHFPIIQCVVAAGMFATSPGMALAVAGGASLFAALWLWWLIERPALRRDSAYRTG